eukprot:TRINITY_DN938_c0_g1_i2.p1 TRINITY_DN938_c0_g1~~TRINITY_DN938_c0_g1_i2.p1  ORF type:complete len:619 (-),score=99.31 TRINITY_DN938_c0_g1_i2:571-2391(-)
MSAVLTAVPAGTMAIVESTTADTEVTDAVGATVEMVKTTVTATPFVASTSVDNDALVHASPPTVVNAMGVALSDSIGGDGRATCGGGVAERADGINVSDDLAGEPCNIDGNVTFMSQVLHKRTYGNRLVFFDVWTCEEPRTGFEVVFDFQRYGKDVRSIGKDISPGDVVEFSGKRRVGHDYIIEAGSYQMLRRWTDVNAPGITFTVPAAAAELSERRRGSKIAASAGTLPKTEGRNGEGDQPPAQHPRERREKRLCKFWVSNQDCRRAGCQCDHPEGEALKRARESYFESIKQKRALNANPDDPHSAEGKRSHGQRSAVFAEWLCSVYGLEELRRDGVVDIAGGRGELAFEFAVKRRIPCTVIDPRCPGGGDCLEATPWHDMRLSRPQRSWLETNVEHLHGFPACQQHVAKCPLLQVCAHVPKDCTSMQDDMHQRWNKLTGGCRVIVGLHSDQATGSVVDLALAFGRPFAVIPCCTFADDFPERRLTDGRPVRTYDDLVAWLQARSPSSEKAFLGFHGKNLVVFCKPEANSSRNGHEEACFVEKGKSCPSTGAVAGSNDDSRSGRIASFTKEVDSSMETLPSVVPPGEASSQVTVEAPPSVEFPEE